MHVRNPIEWFLAQFEEVPAALGSAAPAEYWPEAAAQGAPVIRQITYADLKTALRRGVHDFAAARTDIVFLFIIYPVIALFIAAAEANGALLPLLFPLAAGFALLGPLFAIGLYEMSRQRELTGKISWFDTFRVLRSPQLGAIIGMGLMLIVLFLAWLGAAQVIYDATLGPLPPASILAFLGAVFTTGAGWAMALIGLAVGAVFAVAALAISVVSFPLLLDRHVGDRVAVTTSFKALQRNFAPLMAWGGIVGVSLLLGALPCFIGLIVVLPVLGHATWHLYRAIVAGPKPVF